MALCQSFEDLTPLEKSNYIGSICHLFQSDEDYYQKGLAMIRQATKRGLFEGVKINPIDEANQILNKKIIEQ